MFKTCGLMVQNLFTTTKLIHQPPSPAHQPVANQPSYPPLFAQLRHGLFAAQPSSNTEAATDLYTLSTGPITRAISLNSNKYYYEADGQKRSAA